MKMMFCLLATGAMLLCRAQSVRAPLNTGYAQLTAYSTNPENAFSFTANPAALAHLQKFTAGIYGERRFMLQQLSTYQLAIAVPSTSGNFGLSATYFGQAAYNESEEGLAYGRKLTAKISVGAEFNYYRIQIKGYGQAAAINVAAGLVYDITTKVHAGFRVYNPSRSKIGKEGVERLPFIYDIGLGYDAAENCFITSILEKEEGKPISLKAGLQYNFDKAILARCGLETATSTFFLGLGFLLNEFRVDAFMAVHPQFGLTPSLMLIYTQPDKE